MSKKGQNKWAPYAPMIRDLVSEGCSSEEIAEAIGTRRQNMGTICSKLGIKIPRRTVARGRMRLDEREASEMQPTMARLLSEFPGLSRYPQRARYY